MRLALFSLLALAGSALADRTVSAVFFDAPESAPSKMYIHTGKESLEIELPRMNLSDRVEVPAGDLVLRMTASPVPEGKEIPASAPSVRIPAAWSDVVLLVAVDTKSRTDFPIKVLPVNASPSVFKPGQLLFFNLTSAQLAGTIGDRTLRIKGGASVVLDPPAKGNEDYPVAIDYLVQGDDAPRPLARTTWRNEVEMRHLLFIKDDETRMVPRVWSISLRPSPPPKKNNSDSSEAVP